MSGIVALLGTDGRPIDPSLLDAMVAAMAFRGPDGRGTWLDGRSGAVGLGHAWLDVGLDGAPGPGIRAPLPGGPQPLTLDGEVWLTADARIDGQVELRAELARRGRAVAADASDAALILHAYAVWGVDCARHLIGDFVFTLWDRRARRLVAARDPFGVKPLFYACPRGHLILGNTLEVLRRHPAVTSALDELSIADLLLFRYNLDPERTVFADIRRLPAAHVLVWEAGQLMIRRYWSLPREGALYGRSPADLVDELVAHIDRAVADRLRVPRVGVLMSGGLDSPAIAASAARQLAPPAETVRAVTVVYHRLIPDEERHYAGLAAAHIGIAVDYLAADELLLFDPACARPAHWPEPYDRSKAALGGQTFDAAAAHSRVLLTGFGGDPVQFPEPAYVPRLLRERRLGRLAADLAAGVRVNRRLPPLYLRSGARRWWRDRRGARAELPALPAWLNPALARRLGLMDRWRSWHQAEPAVDRGHPNRPRAADELRHPWWTSLLESYDAGVSGRPIELRHPFFDLRLVDFMLRVPPLPWCADKTLLRRALRGRLPEPVRLRPKAPLAGRPDHRLPASLQPARLRADQTRAFVSLTPEGGVAASAGDVDQATWAWLISLDLWFEQALQPSLRATEGTDHGESPFASLDRSRVIPGLARSAAPV